MAFEIISYAIIGVLAGILSGLLGIGGGIVTIPCLLLVFAHSDIPPQAYMHLAIGTSLAAMVFTTLSGSYTHYKKEAVLFEIVKPMALGVIVGSFLGALITRILPSHFLQIFFGAFECVLGIRFLLPEKPITKHHPLPKFWGLSTIALGVSIFSTMMGVGGGLINVPILSYFHVPVKKAIGTSSALSFLISLCGAISFLLLGVHASKAPDSVGFLYLPAFIIISIISFFVAPYGAKWAHSLPTTILKKVFGGILILAGLSMILN
ncbi:MAG: sulfite exporter TauE/SafE family protein [Simkaniaceae bacterium]